MKLAALIISASVLFPSVALADTVVQKVPVNSTQDCYTLANQYEGDGWFLALAALDEHRQPTCTFRGDIVTRQINAPDETTCAIAANKLGLYLASVLTYRNQPSVVCVTSQKIQ